MRSEWGRSKKRSDAEPWQKKKNNFKNHLESGKRGGAFKTWLGKTRALYWSKKAQRQGSFSSAVEMSFWPVEALEQESRGK